MVMRRALYMLVMFIALLSTETVLASENISLKVDMPKKVVVGEDFTINVDVDLNRSIAGFECTIDLPIYGTEYIHFINATGNEKIKEKAGEFYRIELENDSVFIAFAILFDKPLNTDFHLITVKGKALKEGKVPIRFRAVASDENGTAIRLPTLYYNLTVVGKDKDNNEKTGSEGNIFSWILKSILNLVKMIFGG